MKSRPEFTSAALRKAKSRKLAGLSARDYFPVITRGLVFITTSPVKDFHTTLGQHQEMLVKRYYRGAIPTIALIDSNGKVIYDRAGETAGTRGDTSNLQQLLNSAE